MSMEYCLNLSVDAEEAFYKWMTDEQYDRWREVVNQSDYHSIWCVDNPTEILIYWHNIDHRRKDINLFDNFCTAVAQGQVPDWDFEKLKRHIHVLTNIYGISMDEFGEYKSPHFQANWSKRPVIWFTGAHDVLEQNPVLKKGYRK